MAVNSSNVSLLHPNLPVGMFCLMSRPSSFIFTAYSIIDTLLLLPLCIIVLYLGLQPWWRQRPTSASAMTSHSDSFTYHMVVVELIGVLGCTFCICGIYIWGHVSLLHVGYFLWSFTWYGEIFFHMLTCVERYLAVVHPVTYLSLRGERGIRIRNISIGCVWLLCVVAIVLEKVEVISLYFSVCLLIVSFIVIAFCSLSVLRVLIRPGPGGQGGDRDRVDQSKRRAFYTIVAILGALLLRCFGNLSWIAFSAITRSSECVTEMANIWFNLPSTLVLPLLFLHRAGRFACCKNNT